MNTPEQMKLFMEPRSIAIIGATRSTGKDSLNIVQHLQACGFNGKIYPVNPNATEILGVKAYPSIRDVPEVVDQAVITTERSVIPEIVKDCVAKGIKAINVTTQGFADADEEGKRLQAEIVKNAQKGGARVIGPNCFGLVNPFINFSSAFAKLEMEPIPVGVICQSGILYRLGILGKGIDLGNTCDIDFADGLEYFENDPETKLIVLHVEGISNGKKFFEVASRVTRKKPVIAMKTARSEQGIRIAQSHSGSLAGRDEVYDTAFKQCGIIRVNDFAELKDLVKPFLYLPLMKGRRIGVLSDSGGAGIMIADACEKYGLELAKLSQETIRKFEELSPSWMPIANPVDIFPAYMASKDFSQCTESALRILSAEKNIDAALHISVALRPGIPSQPFLEVVDSFGDRPVVCTLFGLYTDEETQKLEESKKAVVLPSPDRAVRALSRLWEYWQFLQADS